MKTLDELPFGAIWLLDFEFSVPAGEPPRPICMVAKEIRGGVVLRLWERELREAKRPPFSVDQESLFISYYAPAELSCFLALGWPLPANVLDLCVEFKNLTNEREVPAGRGLLGALTYFGIGGIESEEKTEMRELALRGGPWTDEERLALLSYCESDVIALEDLLPKMLPTIDLSRALHRGRYMRALTQMERVGIPLDTNALSRLYQNWDRIEARLVSEIDAQHDYGVYDGTSFSSVRFGQWLQKNDMAWPRLPSGELDLRDDTFKEMSKTYPELQPLRQLRASLSQMRQNKLEVGSDGRNRTALWAFGSKTGRNQPSTSKFIFGLSRWFRGFIKPENGFTLAYIDWCQQEFGIAAAFSGDPAMKQAYFAEDPYLAFAKQAGAAPSDATKESHRDIRKQFKECALGVQYGIGEPGLARKIDRTPAHARELLKLHRETYPQFWAWLRNVLDYAYLKGFLPTVFGWRIHVGPKTRVNTLRNFPMQANGAEMLRLACCLAVERGVRVCAPIHDALLIEAQDSEIETAVRVTQDAMAEASRVILDGFELKSDATVIRWPERFRDEDGEEMWNRVWRLIEALNSEPVHLRTPCLFISGLLPVLIQHSRSIYSLSALLGH